MLIPMAVQSEAWVCSCLLACIVGSNHARGMDVCLSECCILRYWSLQQADRLSRGVLLGVVCLTECA